MIRRIAANIILLGVEILCRRDPQFARRVRDDETIVIDYVEGIASGDY